MTSPSEIFELDNSTVLTDESKSSLEDTSTDLLTEHDTIVDDSIQLASQKDLVNFSVLQAVHILSQRSSYTRACMRACFNKLQHNYRVTNAEIAESIFNLREHLNFTRDDFRFWFGTFGFDEQYRQLFEDAQATRSEELPSALYPQPDEQELDQKMFRSPLQPVGPQQLQVEI